MGLLEKALKYKNEINRKGKDTLIDRIQGPAETEFIDASVKQDAAANGARESDSASVQNPQPNGNDALLRLDENDLVEIVEVQEAPSETAPSERKRAEDESVIAEAGEKPGDAGGVREKSGGKIEESIAGGNIDKAAERAEEKFDGELLPPIEEIADFDEMPQVEEITVPDDMEDMPAVSEKGEALPAVESRSAPGSPDYMVLYDAAREILNAGSKEELFDAILFTIMGQIGSSSATILVQDTVDESIWKMALSQGISVENENLFFEGKGLLRHLLQRKKIVDIDEFSDDQGLREDYLKYISIDAKLLVPVLHGEELVSVLLLGEKLSAEEYSAEDLDFLSSMGEFSAVALRGIYLKGRSMREIDLLHRESDYYKYSEFIIELFSGQKNLDDVSKAATEELLSYGMERFALFLRGPAGDSYYPLFISGDEMNAADGKALHISSHSDFIKYVAMTSGPSVIDPKSVIAQEVFSAASHEAFDMLRIYPSRMGGNVAGFLAVFGTSPRVDFGELDRKIGKFSNLLVLYLAAYQNLDLRSKMYVDNVDYVYRRIENEIQNAKNLEIPLTLVLFSIKNYRRYHNILGQDKTRLLIENFEKIIKNRLADVDFSIRYDRHKFLLVLPGKDKKYAVPLANSIRNEVIHTFSKKEIQLLVTFLIAEFPFDGEDANNLMDAVDQPG